MGAFQPIHFIIIAAVLLLFFGGPKIPQLMRGLGQGMSEFKKGQEESKKPPADEAKKEEVVTGSETK